MSGHKPGKSGKGTGAKPTKVTALGKLQLSVLNSGMIPFERRAQSAAKLLPKGPVDFAKFNSHIQLLRKYEVLLKIEFHVSLVTNPTFNRF